MSPQMNQLHWLSAQAWICIGVLSALSLLSLDLLLQVPTGVHNFSLGCCTVWKFVEPTIVTLFLFTNVSKAARPMQAAADLQCAV